MPWAIQDFIPSPLTVEWKNDAQLKQAFAKALNEGKNAFEAACLVFGKETNKALWASTNWINDELVIEEKQKYIEDEEKPVLLNKEQLSLKLLAFADDKVLYNGNEIYAAEAKDRLAALKLYSEIQGYINNKTEINTNFNTKNNFMEIRFVEP